MLQAGADGRGDGQVFFFRIGPDGKEHLIPTIRVEMLRDCVEDREYFHLLKWQLTRHMEGVNAAVDSKWIDRARELVTVPDALVRTQYESRKSGRCSGG